MDQANIQREERRGVWGWVIRHPKTMIALVLLLMALLTVLAIMRIAENGLAQRIAAIKAKGEPTTIADLLARQRHIPDEENMLLAIVGPADRMEKIKTPEDRSTHLPLLGMGRVGLTGERWSAEEIDAANWYFQQFPKDLAALHAALKLSNSAYNDPWTTPTANMVMPELSLIRHAAKILMLETLSVANSSDQKNAERSLLEALPILRALEGGESLICALVQMAISALACDTVERTVNLVGLSESALARIDPVLHTAERRPDLAAALRAERVLFMATQKWLRSIGGRLSLSTLTTWDITEGLYLHTMLIDTLSSPPNAFLQNLAKAESRIQSSPRYCVLSRITMPANQRAVVLWARTIGQNRALRAALAAERFRLAKGHWPERLDELVPAYLDAVPTDPIDGKQIRYVKIPEGIKTWTIAGDDHNEDNGGDVRRLEPYNPKIRPKDFGWVILNPELRGRPAAEQKPPDKKSTATTLPAKE